MNDRTNDLPILMYHAISSRGVRSAAADFEYRARGQSRDFRAQLDAIVEGGYRTIKLDDLDRPASEPKSLLITFDDGHESDSIVAAPELARRNLHAIFFVVWSYLGRPGYLSRDQVLALRADGFEIGSHGMTHTRLSQISLADASDELLRIEAAVGRPAPGADRSVRASGRALQRRRARGRVDGGLSAGDDVGFQNCQSRESRDAADGADGEHHAQGFQVDARSEPRRRDSSSHDRGDWRATTARRQLRSGDPDARSQCGGFSEVREVIGAD